MWREGTYVYLWLIHVLVGQKPTQHCKAISLQFKKMSKIIEKKHQCLELRCNYKNRSPLHVIGTQTVGEDFWYSNKVFSLIEKKKDLMTNCHRY